MIDFLVAIHLRTRFRGEKVMEPVSGDRRRGDGYFASKSVKSFAFEQRTSIGRRKSFLGMRELPSQFQILLLENGDGRVA